MERVSAVILWLTIGFLALMHGPDGGGASAQSFVDDYVRNNLLKNVVLVDLYDDGVVSKTGAGFIVGREGNTIWIATAAHVVRSSDRIDPPAGAIKVRRFQDTREWDSSAAPRPGFGKTDLGKDIDLAFVPISMPLARAKADYWTEPVVVSDAQPGELAWIAVRPGVIALGEGGAVIGETKISGHPAIRALGGHDGQSGAPIITSRGIVAMFLGKVTDRFIPISVIKEAARVANVPWALKETLSPARHPATICVRHMGPQRPDVRVRGPTVTLTLSDGQCGKTIAAPHLISSVDKHVFCVPAQRDLRHTKAPVHVNVDCQIDPVGFWSAGNYGRVEILRQSEGAQSWPVRGLAMSPYGKIDGRVQRMPEGLLLDAKTQSGATISGMLTLDKQRMSGVMYGAGQPLTLELKR